MLVIFFFQAMGPTMVFMEVSRTATETTETIMETKETMPAMTVMIVTETLVVMETLLIMETWEAPQTTENKDNYRLGKLWMPQKLLTKIY